MSSLSIVLSGADYILLPKNVTVWISKMQDDLKLLEIKNVSKSFARPDATDLFVLDNINFTVFEGEIIAILGRSGSGKSTLLRIISGLISASSGSVFYKGKAVASPVMGLSMVFQNFALMPWLTVLQNVEFGLEALGVPAREREKRALEAIDMIGLDGFETAFPKELSGGMRQRVGLARALVVNPEVLLLDEAFSALDVLTAENLRSDLMDLWLNHKTNIKAMILVTHKIEEAIAMADRILVFDNAPGIIKAEVAVDLPFPRVEHDKRFIELTEQSYRILITPCVGEQAYEVSIPHEQIEISHLLPDVALSQLFGLIESFETTFKDKKVDLAELALKEKQFSEEELLPLFEMLDMLDILHFIKLSPGSVELTQLGQQFANADIQQKKKIFSQQLLLYVPLASYIKRLLNEKADHIVEKDVIIIFLGRYFDAATSERVFKTIVDWGRYAEIFVYDDEVRELSLEDL
jgi:NitT/TauT family transport system ATP-binding protein